MKIELKKNCKHALVVPTSMGIRITPPGWTVNVGGTFIMQATSAESNVASVSSYLGLPVKILTTFVKGSPIAQIIKDNLRSRGMDFRRARKCRKVGRGVTGINLTSPTAGTVRAGRAFGTTVPVKLGAR